VALSFLEKCVQAAPRKNNLTVDVLLPQRAPRRVEAVLPLTLSDADVLDLPGWPPDSVILGAAGDAGARVALMRQAEDV